MPHCFGWAGQPEFRHMPVCVFVFNSLCPNTYTDIHTHTQTHTYTLTLTYTLTQTHSLTLTHVHSCKDDHSHTYTHIHKRSHTHTRTCKNICVMSFVSGSGFNKLSMSGLMLRDWAHLLYWVTKNKTVIQQIHNTNSNYNSQLWYLSNGDDIVAEKSDVSLHQNRPVVHYAVRAFLNKQTIQNSKKRHPDKYKNKRTGANRNNSQRSKSKSETKTTPTPKTKVEVKWRTINSGICLHISSVVVQRTLLFHVVRSTWCTLT